MAEILRQYIHEMTPVPFRYGAMDCGLFVVGWADVITGKAGCQKWMGRYNDMLSCRQFIADNGGAVALADSFLGDTYGVGRADRPAVGNIVCATLGSITAMGLRLSNADLVFKIERGMTITKRAAVTAEWGVGCHN